MLFPYAPCGMVQKEREALVALYDATGGANWRRKTNWKTDADLSHWHGIEVNDQGLVMTLMLVNNNLRGTFWIRCGQPSLW